VTKVEGIQVFQTWKGTDKDPATCSFCGVGNAPIVLSKGYRWNGKPVRFRFRACHVCDQIRVSNPRWAAIQLFPLMVHVLQVQGGMK
jgi:hypothetical protein